MPFCSFDRDAGMFDVTPIENMFLLEYLPTAPDDFLRVYLYARMLCLHPELGDGFEDMARVLHMDEDTLFNAMTFWERQGLVRRMTDRPPTYAILPMRGGWSAANPMENDYYEYRDFNANLQAVFGSELLQPKQYEMANDWINILGFTQDAVLKMVEEKYRTSRARKPYTFFKNLNETAVQWAERGVRSAEDVAAALEYDERVDKTAAAVMKRFAMHRQATLDEQRLVARWLNEWGFTPDEILAACAETTKSRTPTMAYLNSILESRRKGGGDTFDAVKAVLKELGDGHQPTPDQLDRYEKLLAAGFEPETIRLAAVQCARKRKKRFEEVEWMLGKWAEMKLFRFAEADGYVRDMNRVTAEVRALLEKCGSERRPQLDDIAMYESWTAAFSAELISYAAECARGMQLPMRYIDKLLAEWKKSGVTTPEAARAQHEGRASRGAGNASAAQNPALNYEQRSAAETDYSGRIIDLSQYYEEEGEQT